MNRLSSLFYKLLFRCFLAFSCLLVLAKQGHCVEGLPEADKRTILRLQTTEGNLGTGFLLVDSTVGYFIITNKHVVWSCSTGTYFDSVYMRPNTMSDGRVVAKSERLTVHLRRHGQDLFEAHPDKAVDLILIRVGNLVDSTGMFQNPPGFGVLHAFEMSLVADRSDFDRLGIRDGTEVQVIGFSFQVRQGDQFHVSRFGHISVSPGMEFSIGITPPCGDRPELQRSDWVVLDLTSRSGDSGGPIYAFPRRGGGRLVGLVQAVNQSEELCFGVPSYRIHELLRQAQTAADQWR